VYTVVVVYGVILGLCVIPSGSISAFMSVHSVMIAPPLLYVNCLPIWVWWYGYLPPLTSIISSSGDTARTSIADMRNKAMRDLALYYFRVVFIFMILYVPVSILTFNVLPWRLWCAYVNETILAIQPALTFIFLLTKPDVKTYILDLITLPYLMKRKPPLPQLQQQNQPDYSSKPSEDKTALTNGSARESLPKGNSTTSDPLAPKSHGSIDCSERCDINNDMLPERDPETGADNMVMNDDEHL